MTTKMQSNLCAHLHLTLMITRTNLVRTSQGKELQLGPFSFWLFQEFQFLLERHHEWKGPAKNNHVVSIGWSYLHNNYNLCCILFTFSLLIRATFRLMIVSDLFSEPFTNHPICSNHLQIKNLNEKIYLKTGWLNAAVPQRIFALHTRHKSKAHICHPFGAANNHSSWFQTKTKTLASPFPL